MNRVEGLLARLKSSKDLIALAFLVVLLLTLVGFLTSANVYLTISILICVLPLVRLVYGEKSTIRISTMRSNGKSLAFSDERRKRFAAFSAVEIRTAQLVGPEADELQRNRSKVLKASKVIAEHIGAYSIEVSNRESTVRYLVSAEAKTASDACQKAEAAAERMLRVIRELHGDAVGPGIIEGERLRSVFLSIIGGDFESFNDAGNVVVRDGGRNGERCGFAILTAMDSSFAKVDLKRLISMIRNPDVNINYVINVEARRTYNENVLIDGAEYGRTWVVSSYFVVSGREVKAVDEVSTKLRNDIEDMTRAGVLRIERGSSIISRIGRILLRSRIGKKLFLSNGQLITHVFGIPSR